MPAFTPNRNFYLPGGGSLGLGGADEAVDIDKINQNMIDLDEWSGDVDDDVQALKDGALYRVGTNSERLAIEDAQAGLVFRVLERDLEYFWDGSNWIPQWLLQTGTTTITGDGDTYTSTPVEFEQPFSTVPVMMVGSEMGGSTTNTVLMVGKATSVTTTGFSLQLKASANFSSTYQIPWYAYGKAQE